MASMKKSLTPSVDTDAVETINSALGDDSGAKETPAVDPVVGENTPVVEIQPQASAIEATPITPDETKIPEVEQNVKIRLRVDHRCCIALERYDFKAGKVYTVSPNVKRILNNAGLLAPL